MPPRIPIVPSLRASNSCPTTTPFTLSIRSFTSSSTCQARTAEERAKLRASRDPYLVAQRALKKTANLSRRAELEQGRVASLGDPVRGTATPFVQSFDTGKPVTVESAGKKIPKGSAHLNYAFDPETVQEQLRKSEKLAVPLGEIGKQTPVYPYQWSGSLRYNKTSEIQTSANEIEAQNKKDHARAAEAIARITALENGSSKDRMRVNKLRCIKTFGRHYTDRIFPPRAPPLRNLSDSEHPIRPETNVAAAGKRAGPDTGSSEVQIAILTAKIKTLADFLAARGKGDKHNKRNLRLLVHKRQKLLQYLRRKERGGPRWQHCIETLGLTEGTWRGEISL
ncbi:ribosomal protein-like protein S15 [Setomelanomma holmii]|uniref:Ribosomal protein-like protein S15 n=1 Tax=Setomelanomma holmii TaxID=210430 RepID=A0A9P4H620_9PLEO|nr:ribosomal protein-like protein S15 [Setomelanomma holmii]